MKLFNSQFFKLHWPKFILTFFFIFLLASYAHIFAIGSPYNPGETLDPACPPGELNCTVSIGGLDAYVPYTGGTSDVDLGSHNLIIDTNSLFVNSVSNNVGIRTTNPTTPLYVYAINGASGIGTFASGGSGGEQTLLKLVTPAVNNAWMGFFTTENENIPLIRIGRLANTGILSFETKTSEGDPLETMRLDETGRVGIGTTTPTAVLHLKAGTAAVSTAPLKLTSGTNLTTTEAGAVEYDGSHLYFTAVDSGTRYQLDQSSPITVVNTSNLFSTGLLGTGAGVTTGAYDSNFFGEDAGNAASSAFSSNFFGWSAGSYATNASRSNFFGEAAGSYATNASRSNFLGLSAGQNAASASNSNFLGYNAGKSATNASNSIFIGQQAGYGDTVNNTSNGLSSILLGSFTNTGGFSNSILLGSGIAGIGNQISNTKANQFMLAPSVTEMQLRGIDYSLPSVQGGASTVLTNDGSGGLTWASAGGGGTVTGTGNTNEIAYFTGTSAIGSLAVATYPSLTELSYIKGVTSAIQTQLNGKQASGSYLTANQTITLGGILSGSGTTSITASAASGYYMPSTTDQTNWNGKQAAYTILGTLGGLSNASGVLTNNGSGGLTWTSPVTSPITIVNSSSLFSTGLTGTGAGVTATTYSNFFGVDAGNAATGASYSNFFGFAAGSGATGAQYSNFFGQNAGTAATTASFSNFLGYYAGYAATTASFSNFFGSGAGGSASSASYSNFLGQSAGANATSAFHSNFLGAEAGALATNANDSIFIGQNAGYQAASASNSNFLGSNAGYNAATASNSNFLGLNAGASASSASNSIFIGQNSGLGDTVNNTMNTNDWSILLGYNTNTGGNKNSILLGGSSSGTAITNTKANQFMLADTVTEMRLRGIDYTLPSSQGGASTVLTNNGSGGLTWEALPGGGMVYPGAGIANSTGSAWGTSYTTSGTGTELALTTSPTFTGTTTLSDVSITGSIIPTVDKTYDLGSLTNMWHSVYVGPGSLYVNGQKVLQTDTSNSVVISSDINQNLITKTSGTGNIEMNPSGTGQILLKGSLLISGGKNITTSDSLPLSIPFGITTLSNISATGTISGSNFSGSSSGSNTGDETQATIQTKLGTASTSTSGYLTSTDWNTFNNKQAAGSYLTGTKVDSFNTRTGAVTLSSADVTGALTFTPYNATNPSGYISSYTETDPTISAWAKAGTKPTYTATEVGLGNVTNESKSTMFTSPTFTGTVAGFTMGGNLVLGSNTITTSNTGLVSNLNADLLDGHDASYFVTASGYIPYTGGTSNVDLGIHNFTVDTNSLFVDSANHRVGIGKTTPATSLEVNGNITLTAGGGQTITTPGTSLTLTQTGDAFGATSLTIQSRQGSAGALFSSATLDLVDFGFKGKVGYQSNLRYEHRDASLVSALNSGYGEFQFIDNPNAVLPATGTTTLTIGKGATIINSNNVGIGTTNPGEKLEVSGSIKQSGCITPGTISVDASGKIICTASSIRFKNNRTDLMDGLQIIAQLQPVSYIFNENMNLGKEIHFGFISEEVNSVNQALATHDAVGAPYGLDSTAILAVTVNAVKELNLKLESINTMETDNSFRGILISWFANVGNGIGNIFAGTFRAKDKLCINSTCVTESQLQSLLANANVGGNGGSGNDGGDTTAPVITLVGSTPINIDIDGVYADVGATAVDNVDGDITNKIKVTGLPIDTSLQGIFTIHYNIADVAGNKATEVTRVVNVGGTTIPANTPPAPNTLTCVLPEIVIDGACAIPPVTPPPPTCTGAQILVNNICTAPIQADPTCTAPQILVNHVCTDPIQADPTCTAPQILVNHVCTDQLY